LPQAFVVRRTALTDNELMAWVAERVTPYKRIRRVEFVESIPKSPSAKSSGGSSPDHSRFPPVSSTAPSP
jgi:acyl-coenzyme A synthetase/AMP-(fatty) acid ligase